MLGGTGGAGGVGDTPMGRPTTTTGPAPRLGGPGEGAARHRHPQPRAVARAPRREAEPRDAIAPRFVREREAQAATHASAAAGGGH